MNDENKRISKLAVGSVVLGLLNFVVVGTLIIQSLYVPYDWIDFPERELEFAANRLLAGNLALVSFPVVAIVGIVLAIAGLLRGGGRKTSVGGIVIGTLALAAWLIGIVWWQIAHNLDRLYVK